MRNTVLTCPYCGKRNRTPTAARGYPRCAICHRSLPWIVDADDNDFALIAEQANQPVIVDMWATWCGPCRMVSPVLEQLAKERAGAVKLVKVDVDKSPALSRRFAVQAVPTLLILENGEAIARQAGAAPLEDLRGWLDDSLKSAKDEPDRRNSRSIADGLR